MRSETADCGNRKITQAHPYSLEFLIKLDEMVADDDVEIEIILLAPAILLTVRARLHFSDLQRLATFNVADAAIHGSLTECNVSKQHILPWLFAAIWGGFSNRGTWFRPIVDFRQSVYAAHEVYPTYIAPVINEKWIISELSPANYNNARRRLLMLAITVGDKNAEMYTLHSGKDFYPTCGRRCAWN